MRALVMCTDDPVVVRRLRQIADERGLTVMPSEEAGDGTSLAVVDLERPDALSIVRAWRDRWPEALVAGHLATPDPKRWVAAQRAGCDVVANRGALALRLRERLVALGGSGTSAGHRYPLFETADMAGRLGLVHRSGDTPVGPLAVYHVGGRLYAVADRCPHTGAMLSDGEVEGTVLSCPRHGSRFDVCTGERVRGPADADLATFRLVEEGGQVFLLAGAEAD